MNSDKIHFIENLKLSLNLTLPGESSHRLMWPEGRESRIFEHKHTAAVLLALIQEDNEWRIPLILRAEDGYAHGGQVGLPGGRIKTGESVEDAALREAQEEVGLSPNRVEIIGRLTTLKIPVSQFLVHPVLGIIHEHIEWNLDPREVQYLFTINLTDLLNPEVRQEEIWDFPGGKRKIPFFYLQNKKIWGATAMILCELKTIIEQLEYK